LLAASAACRAWVYASSASSTRFSASDWLTPVLAATSRCAHVNDFLRGRDIGEGQALTSA
jgi:hypothetical protein